MPSTSSHLLTVAEAGFVLDKPPRDLNNAIDKGEVQAKVVGKKAPTNVLAARAKAKTRVRTIAGTGKRVSEVIRQLGPAELRYFKVVASLDLSPGGGKRIYQALRKLPEDAQVFKVGDLELKLDAIDRKLHQRVNRLTELRRSVEQRGDTVYLKATNVPVYPIAALQKSMSLDEILAGYPSLTRTQVEAALDFARAYPKPGRPYPSTTLKRRMATMAAAGMFDVDTSGVEISPEMLE